MNAYIDLETQDHRELLFDGFCTAFSAGQKVFVCILRVLGRECA